MDYPLAEIDWDRLVTLDFETYYDTEYTLSKMSTSEYIRDPRFKAQMVGIKIGRKPTKYYPAEQVKRALQAINWTTHALLCHNTAFDGLILSHHYGIIPARYYDTLSMARGLHSNEIGAGLEEVSIYYGGTGKIKDVLDSSKGVLKWSAQMNKDVGAYCVVDVDECYRVFGEMIQIYPASEIELIHMTIRMFCAPVLRVDIPRVQKEYDREVTERKELLLSTVDTAAYDQMGTTANGKPKYLGVLAGPDKLLEGEERQMRVAKKVIGSNEKFINLLVGAGIPEDCIPRKISPAWMKLGKAEREESIDKKWAYAFAKDDLDFVDLPHKVFDILPELDPNDADDVAKAAAISEEWDSLIKTRLAVKSTTNITRAARFLEAGKNGWALPAGYSYYRAHCVPGDTEVLTREGWTRLDEWQGGEIAQVHTDQRIEFLEASKFEGPIESAWLHVDAPYLRCDFTLGHTMPYLKQKTHQWATEQAGDFLSRPARDVPIGGTLIGEGMINPEQMRVLAMIQADGHFETNAKHGRGMAVFVKKQRKVERARRLLTEAKVVFRESSFPSHPGMVRFSVRHADYPTWLSPDRKLFGSWLFDSTAEARTALFDELEHWDGYRNHAGCLNYSTSDRTNAEWVVTMAHLVGKSASIYTAAAKGNRRENFCVSVRERAFAKIDECHKQLVRSPRKTFCASTRTGFWLARVGDRIFVTGNTGRFGGNNKMNLQNLTRKGELRLSILADKGHALAVCDSGQIEARVNAWLWDQEETLDAFRASDAYDREVMHTPKELRRAMLESERDAYCRFADNVYGRTIWKDDTDERFLGKVCVLGLGFQMGAAKFQMTLAKGALGGPRVNYTLAHCQEIVSTFRRVNYRIAEGWKKCVSIIEDMAANRYGEHKCLAWGGDDEGGGWILLPNGMCLKYPALHQSVNEETGWNEWTYQSGPMRKKIYGGLLCENVVQALARIIVMDQTMKIDTKYPVVMTTHDEAVAHPKLRQAQKCYDFMYQCMLEAPAWCPDIPLAAEGGWATNYSK